MQDKFETGYKFAVDHPEALMLAGGTFFVLLSLFTISAYLGPEPFAGFLFVSLFACGIALYVFRFMLKRIFRRAFNERFKLEG